LVLGAVLADWSNRRELSAAVSKAVNEMNTTLTQVGEVHNKQTLDLAALSERVTALDLKTTMVGSRSPFGKQ